MTDSPSDRAYAQAFREREAISRAEGLITHAGFCDAVNRRAREIDAAAPEGAQAPELSIRPRRYSETGQCNNRRGPVATPPSLGGEDSDRMDWLDKNGMAVRERGNARHNLIVWSPTSEAPYRNIREAIDASRAAGGE